MRSSAPSAHQRHARPRRRAGSRPGARSPGRRSTRPRPPIGKTIEVSPNFDRRVAEHLLRVEREDERHPVDDRAEEEHHARSRRRACASGRCAAARAARRWRARSSTKATSSTAETTRRPIVCALAPAVRRRLDDRVHEQRERAGDRQRAGRVEASRRRRRRGSRGGAPGESASAATPTGMLMKKIHCQPGPSTSGPPISQRGRRADPAERAPDPERLVALGALLEGRHDDRERGRGHDRRADALERARADQRGRRPREPAEKRGDGEDDERRP